MKLTVKEYATSLDVSIQSVYKKIKRGSLPTVKENNIIYVVVDSLRVERVVKPVQSNECTELLDIIRRRDKEVKQLYKEIKRLTKELSRAKDGKSEVLEKFIFEMQQLQAPKEDAVDITAKKKSKKKKRKVKNRR